ncbi:hypothetical protein [Streptomyces sp. NPDC004267]|uniref:hypothetical protein n=1 Tax=Streptomyces sp. NPDC004267 TaxID=3364694 RepID=UPI0036ABF36A
MTHPRSPLRALRAALFAAVCVTLAAVGHSSMSAHSIPVSSLLAAFAATTVLAWAAAGRRRGPAVLVPGLAAVQGALHLLFGAGEPGGTAAGAGSMAGSMAHMPGMTMPMGAGAGSGMGAGTATALHAGMSSGMGSGTGSALHAGMSTGMGSGAGMLAVHVLAALACGLWLARGEAALFALARTAGALALAPLRVALAVVRLLVPVPPPPRPVRPRTPARVLRGVLLAQAVPRRGPPRLSAPRATALGARTV